ncbi:hypothetical protein [Halodesulfovibrio aestuarii]|uniref:Uncharacterized protein n=1 Tax=Halodesulfovibrio aestuarii TaxID=126333 RepID=A0ABV4JVZ5_9BACT
MRDPRSKFMNIGIKRCEGDKEHIGLGLFLATKWPSKHGPEGMVRVQQGETWVSRDNAKYDWFTPEAVGELVAREIRKAMGLPVPVPAPPDIAPNTPVCAWTYDGMMRTSTLGRPLMRYGQLKVKVVGVSYMLPIECIELLSAEE